VREKQGEIRGIYEKIQVIQRSEKMFLKLDGGVSDTG